MVSCNTAISPHEHEFKSTIYLPTCVKDGYTNYQCVSCDYQYNDNYVAALGHHFSIWREIVSPGCESEGLRERTCLMCDFKETEPINSIGHNYQQQIIKEATCEEPGLIKYICSNNPDHFYTSEIAPKGHVMQEWYTAIEASCEEAGKSIRFCANCSYYEERPLDCHGHKYVANIIKLPTCSESGIVEYVCEYDHNHSYIEELAKLSHDYVLSEQKAATCTTNGYLKYTCANDNSHTYIEIIEKTGHNLTNWIEVEKSSCEGGSEWRHCTNCDYEETRNTKLGHLFREGICTRCGIVSENSGVKLLVDNPLYQIYNDETYPFIMNNNSFQSTNTASGSSSALIFIAKANISISFGFRGNYDLQNVKCDDYIEVVKNEKHEFTCKASYILELDVTHMLFTESFEKGDSFKFIFTKDTKESGGVLFSTATSNIYDEYIIIDLLSAIPL